MKTILKYLKTILKYLKIRFRIKNAPQYTGLKDKGIKYEDKITVCVSNKSKKYSLRKESYLFWTGTKKDSWIIECDEVWESPDRNLAYAVRELVQYSLFAKISMAQILADLTGELHYE